MCLKYGIMDRFPFPTKLISNAGSLIKKPSHDKFIFISLNITTAVYAFEKGSQVIKIQSGIIRK